MYENQGKLSNIHKCESRHLFIKFEIRKFLNLGGLEPAMSVTKVDAK